MYFRNKILVIPLTLKLDSKFKKLMLLIKDSTFAIIFSVIYPIQPMSAFKSYVSRITAGLSA